MTRLANTLTRFTGLLLATLLVPALSMADVTGMGNKSMRDIEEFVERQGAFCIRDDFGDFAYTDTGDRYGTCPFTELLFAPPVKNFLGLGNADGSIGASVDYAGLTDVYLSDALGTEYRGKIEESALPDGRAKVRVSLKTTNAFSYAVVNGDYAEGALLFGSRVDDGGPYALGESKFDLEFTNTAVGAPLPDLIQLLIVPEAGQEILFLKFYAEAQGPLPGGGEGTLLVREACPAPCSPDFVFSKETIKIQPAD